jgi:hypothetical protein
MPKGLAKKKDRFQGFKKRFFSLKSTVFQVNLEWAVLENTA